MSWFIPTISAGVLIELRCPHCRRSQLRVRKPKKTEYVCKFCYRPFKREDGEEKKSATRR